VILVQVRDDDRVDLANDLARRHGQGDERVPARVRRALDRRPSTDVVEHRIDEQTPAADLDPERRMAIERQQHARIVGGARAAVGDGHAMWRPPGP
jgi:hypothetical protein